MLTEALALIESEQRNSPCRPFDNRSADNGPFLVIHKADQADDFRDRHFALILYLLRTHLRPSHRRQILSIGLMTMKPISRRTLTCLLYTSDAADDLLC